MRSSVLDSYAVLAYLFRERGHEVVVSLLEKAAESNRNALIAAPNWAEVRYQVQRKTTSAKWDEVRDKLLALPIEVVAATQELAEVAGAIKADKKMSLVDCFAVALAKAHKAEVYTGDPGFKAVENEIKIVWI